MSDCNHMKVTRYVFFDTQAPADLWACSDCGHKFVPAVKHFAVEAERDDLLLALHDLRNELAAREICPGVDGA